MSLKTSANIKPGPPHLVVRRSEPVPPLIRRSFPPKKTFRHLLTEHSGYDMLWILARLRHVGVSFGEIQAIGFLFPVGYKRREAVHGSGSATGFVQRGQPARLASSPFALVQSAVVRNITVEKVRIKAAVRKITNLLITVPEQGPAVPAGIQTFRNAHHRRMY